MKTKMMFAALLAVLVAMPVMAEVSQAEFDAMKKDMLDMRSKMAGMKSADETSVVSAVDAIVANDGPQSVVTGKGKLTMGGLVQVWYSHIENDNDGLFHDAAGTGILDTNEASDNDGFRVRNVELYFDMAIHDKVSAFVYINPGAEAGSYPQSAVGQKRLANVSPEFDLANGPFLGASTGTVGAVQSGAGSFPSLLQDAIINFHGIVPHHDFTVGQMLNTFNEENFRSDAELDFVERSYIGNSVARDLGAVIHGSWWCSGGGGTYAGAGDTGRLQYWLGVWNGAGNLHGTGGDAKNRGDDNDEKDFVGTIQLRPIWSDCWGKLELGYSFRGGRKGEAGSGLPASAPVNGLDRKETWSVGHDAWAKYYAPGVFKGLWFKGEALMQEDRNAGGSVISQVNADFQLAGDQAARFKTFGWYGSVGYNLGDSKIFCPESKHWMKNFEFALRAESAPNVFVADPGNDGHTNVYHTKVYTPGINYYIKGQNCKIQANYNFVDNPDGPDGQRFHNLDNNSFTVNFQVMW